MKGFLLLSKNTSHTGSLDDSRNCTRHYSPNYSRNYSRNYTRGILLLGLLAITAGCAHKVQVEAPKEPITINLNVKIEHEILVKVDKEIDEVLDENDELF